MRSERPTAWAARRNVSSVTEGTAGSEESIELPTARPHPSGHLHFGQTLFLHRLRELLGNHFLNRVVFARLKYSLVGKEVIERLSADSAFLFSGH